MQERKNKALFRKRLRAPFCKAFAVREGENKSLVQRSQSRLHCTAVHTSPYEPCAHTFMANFSISSSLSAENKYFFRNTLKNPLLFSVL
jgi:hypothetical protein